MKSSSLVQIYKDFLNGKCTITPNVMSMKETLIKSPSSLFFIFEMTKNRFDHDLNSNVTIAEITEINSLISVFDSGVLKLFNLYSAKRSSNETNIKALYNIISLSTALVSAFKKHVSSIFIDQSVLKNTITKVLNSETNDLLHSFYGHLITKHSLYGLVFWMHKNPGKPINWKRVCKEFMILNELDPSKEEELLEHFSPAVACLVKETTVSDLTNSLLIQDKHYFTSDLNARMLELLGVEQTGLNK